LIWHRCSYFSEFILEFNSVILLVVDFHRQRDDCDDFVDLDIYWLSPSEVLIEIEFYVLVFIVVSIRAL